VYSDDEETRKWSEVNRPCVGGEMDDGVIGRGIAMVELFVFLCVVLCEQGALINQPRSTWLDYPT
jgi:hypothetical protein